MRKRSKKGSEGFIEIEVEVDGTIGLLLRAYREKLIEKEIAAKNVKLAIQVLEELKNFNEEMPMIFHMVVRQFRILLQIKDCMDRKLREAEIRSEVPEHPFVITNGMKQALNFTMDQLKDIYTSLLDIERDFKSGGVRISVNDQTELELALQKLVVTHC